MSSRMADVHPTPQVDDGSQSPASVDLEPWIEALRFVAQHYRLSMSIQAARLSVTWSTLGSGKERIRALARGVGLRVKFVDPAVASLSSWHLPVLVELRSGKVGVIVACSAAGDASVVFSGDQGLETPLSAAELFRDINTIAIARPTRSMPDARVDTYIKPYQEHWLRRIVLRDFRPYGHVMLASVVANTLGLTGILFSMQVYDRVVPAESFPTLYVLFSGVVLAIALDFVMRRTRTKIVDLLGKRADLRISDHVMGHALRVRMRARPASTGTFIAQIRDLQQVREILTSSTVTALADIPFFLLFLVVLYVIAGSLVIVPVIALLLMVVPGIVAQRKLRTYAQEAMRESSLRNAILIESIQGIEDIKTLQAEDRFQQQWNHLNEVTADAQIKLRDLTSRLSTWTHNVQMGTYALIVFIGAPLVIAGDMTTGALVAASILGSRMMAPMSQLAQLITRIQQAKVAAKSLDGIMRMPIDHPREESRIHSLQLLGKYDLKSAVFRYGDDNSPVALTVPELRINAGEKIAILGKNGAGKSTLLQALSGLLEPSSGEILLDDLALRHIDPSDVRRDIGLLTQNARLFHGTLRDNIIMGAPKASQEELMEALDMVGASEFIRKLARGLDHVVQEGGQGLSGGQKQAVLLARLLIRRPNIALLDEPTASMDEATERHFIQHFRTWSSDRTIIVATHRMRVLELVDRIVVVDNGAIVLNDSKESALLFLRGLNNVKSASAKLPAQHTGAM